MRKHLAVVSVAAALVSAVLLAGCGGSGEASPAEVADAASATSCDKSGFYIVNKLTQEKDAIYDCRFAGKLPKCVTYSGNIASDATDEVQLLFANAISSEEPACLTEVKVAKARIAAANRAARLSAQQAALRRAAKETWHQGYTPIYAGIGIYDLPNIYWKWENDRSCDEFASNGCWHVEIVTRNGCLSGASVELEELQDGRQVGSVYGSTGALSPQTPAIIELDSDSGDALKGRIGSIACA